jgi:hypothetical protein
MYIKLTFQIFTPYVSNIHSSTFLELPSPSIGAASSTASSRRDHTKTAEQGVIPHVDSTDRQLLASRAGRNKSSVSSDEGIPLTTSSSVYIIQASTGTETSSPLNNAGSDTSANKLYK